MSGPAGVAQRRGDVRAEFHMIVDASFSSTIVTGQRIRVDLHRVGLWFGDPRDVDLCLSPNSPPTPSDRDKEAGVLAINWTERIRSQRGNAKRSSVFKNAAKLACRPTTSR
jgi:hypothetical protein